MENDNNKNNRLIPDEPCEVVDQPTQRTVASTTAIPTAREEDQGSRTSPPLKESTDHDCFPIGALQDIAGHRPDEKKPTGLRVDVSYRDLHLRGDVGAPGGDAPGGPSSKIIYRAVDVPLEEALKEELGQVCWDMNIGNMNIGT